MAAAPGVVHAYRHLLRAGLRAIQFSKPARFALRDQLRAGFRAKGGESSAAMVAPTLDEEAVRRTIAFLDAAAAERGLEHRILKNLLRVAWERRRMAEQRTWAAVMKERASKKKREPDIVKATAYRHYERTIAMLNQTMGLCLR